MVLGFELNFEVTRAGFEPAISTLRGWRPGPLDERANGSATEPGAGRSARQYTRWGARGRGVAAATRLAQGLAGGAVGLADDEAHGADGVGDAADLVVDDAGGGAGEDQVALVDITCFTTFGG